VKIVFINGSPKEKDSASGIILDDLGGCLDGHAITEYGIHAYDAVKQSQMEELAQQDVMVFAFPLYVDAIPSHLLRALIEMENYFKSNPSKAVVYAIVNCGFYEGKQTENALDMIRNWCGKSCLKWGQGAGLGGGGMLPAIKNIPVGCGPRKTFSSALRKLARNAEEKRCDENLFVSPALPRFLFKLTGEMGWRSKIRHNGLKVKDMHLRK